MIYLYHVFLFWSHLNIFHVLLAAVYCIFKDVFSPTRNAVKREKEYKKKKTAAFARDTTPVFDEIKWVDFAKNERLTISLRRKYVRARGQYHTNIV